MPKISEEEMEKMRKAAEDKMRTIDFQVDTVSVDAAAGTAAYYRSGNNTITSNYEIEDDDSGHKYNQSNETLTHEQKHRDNYLQGFYAYAVSPEQAYKRNMHDEISATMAELISLRNEYIKTGDINVFDRIPKLSFYKEAIEKGEINPKSQYKEDFDKDMRLIVNGTQKMWTEKYGRDFYIDSSLWEYRNRGDHEGKYAAYWDQNYQNSLKIAYNIGGVDFTEYMDKDVEIPQEAYDKIAQEVLKNPSKQKYYHLTDEQVFKNSGLPPYDGSISLHQYKQLLQHQLAINKFGNNHREESIYNSETDDYTVKKYTLQEYLGTLSFDKCKQEYEQLISPKNKYAEDNKKYFPTFESYRQFNHNVKDFQEKFNTVAENEAFIDKIVEYQAQKYAKTGKDFPQDNPENYQKALNKLYCGAYDLLKPDETKLKSELSKPAEKIQNKSAWERTMENYLKAVGVSPEDAEYKAHNLAQKNKFIGGWGCFVGGPLLGAYTKAKDLKHRMTHIEDIEDEFGGEKYVGLWGKIKHKAKEMKEDVKGWFKKSEPVKNEPTHPVNKQAPEYRQWKNEDGSRVSEVQHRKILDMNKGIIRQPTKSYDLKSPHVEKPDNLRVSRPPQHTDTPNKSATIARMKSDVNKSQKAASQGNKTVTNKSKDALKNTMKKDAAKAQQVASQTTQRKKVAKFGKKGYNQQQVLKNLYDKVFGR